MKKGKRQITMMLAGVMTISLAGCGAKEDDFSAEALNGGNNHSLATEVNKTYDDVCTEASDVCEADMCDEWVQTDYWMEPVNNNEYTDYTENVWKQVTNNPLSTFAADVDTASYTELRRMLENGYDVDPDAVRIEEMINYFSYDYKKPTADEKFAVSTEYADCPWNPDHKLAMISLNTQAIDFSDSPRSNLVFLIDTSGSMYDSDKLPLLVKSFSLLAENLSEKDRVSIVTYAGSDEVLLEGAKGSDYKRINEVLESLTADGSTNGSAGIITAYEIAQKYFIKGGNNRVILATDGDLNVGLTSNYELEELITEKKKSGVYLSVLGVGYGNYKDDNLELLADKGNGNYAYIDSLFEAKKALVDDMGANLVTVAKDVKLQVEFNPAYVEAYRLLGYENRTMAATDFSDDTKDGGEMGAGHSVTALYELEMADSADGITLKYGSPKKQNQSEAYSDELFTVNVRYKEVDQEESKLKSYICKLENYSEAGSDNLKWAAAVAEFGLYLMGSEYAEGVTPKHLTEYVRIAAKNRKDPYSEEFVRLVGRYFDLRCY